MHLLSENYFLKINIYFNDFIYKCYVFFAYFKRNLQYLFIRNIRCIELVDEESIILSVLYSTLSDEMGPETKAAIPTDLSDNIRMLVAIRVITLLSGEEAFLPKKLNRSWFTAK